MDIHIIPCLKDNYAYIVENKKTKNACVIDPSESAPIKDFLNKNKLNLKFILNTHHHADHVGGNLELKKEFNSKILGFEKDKERIPGIDIVLKNRQIWNFENSDVLIEPKELIHKLGRQIKLRDIYLCQSSFQVAFLARRAQVN